MELLKKGIISILSFFLWYYSIPTVNAQKKILIVGDSWAETIWRTNIFDSVCLEEGYPPGLAEGGEGDKKIGNLTAIGGSRAGQWAENYNDWQSRIKTIITQNPSISFIHLIIGGNDIIRIAANFNIMDISPLLREHQWNIIQRNIQKLVDFCLTLKPDLKVLISDYDYLNIANAKKVYNYDFGGMSQKQLNEAFAEVGLKKMEIANSTERCFYLENWGVLNSYYNNPKIRTNWHLDYPENDINAFMPAEADIGDGIHPNAEAHKIMLRRAFSLFYNKFLGENQRK